MATMINAVRATRRVAPTFKSGSLGVITEKYFKFFIVCMVFSVTGCYHYPPSQDVFPRNETVILVHGVARTVISMRPLAVHLARSGYDVHVIHYYSTRNYISGHAGNLEKKIIRLNIPPNNYPVHFITHSLGGIVVRKFLIDHPHDLRIGRTVMIAPPNKGSEFADRLFNIPFLGLLCIPLHELTTDKENTVNSLGNPAFDYEIGIIAGGKRDKEGFRTYIPGDDDSTVSVVSTHLQGEKDHIVIKDSHHGLLSNKQTAVQVIHFLESGTFKRERNCTGDPAGRLRNTK